MTDFKKISEGVNTEAEAFALINRGYSTDERKAGQWFEVAHDVYDYFLGVLPPKHWSGTAFAMCETATNILTDAWVMYDGKAFNLTVEIGNERTFSATVDAFREHLSEQVPA